MTVPPNVRLMPRVYMPKVTAEDVEKLKSDAPFLMRVDLPYGSSFFEVAPIPSLVDMIGMSRGGGMNRSGGGGFSRGGSGRSPQTSQKSSRPTTSNQGSRPSTQQRSSRTQTEQQPSRAQTDQRQAAGQTDRFAFFTTLDLRNIGPGSGARIAAQLEADVAAGAIVPVFKGGARGISLTFGWRRNAEIGFVGRSGALRSTVTVH